MKVLVVLFAGMFLFTGCNNLDSGSYPSSSLPPDNSACSSNRYEFCLYEDQLMTFDADGSIIHCLSIGDGPYQSDRVMVGITYASPSLPDEWVDFYTFSPNNRHTLSGNGNPELILLRVEKTENETKAWFKLLQKFRL